MCAQKYGITLLVFWMDRTHRINCSLFIVPKHNTEPLNFKVSRIFVKFHGVFVDLATLSLLKPVGNEQLNPCK